MKSIFILLLIVTFTLCDSLSNFGNPCNPETRYTDCGEQLICFNSTCTNCIEDTEQCGENSYSDSTICKNVKDSFLDIDNNGITHICEHKDLFDSFNVFDGICIFLTYIVGSFVALSGTGGGGIFVILVLTLLEFPSSVAARIGKAVIFGSAIANFLAYVTLKHPIKNVPLINYNIAVIMEPYIIAGTIFGVILNIIFPNWALTLLLITILIVVNIRVYYKYKKLRDKKIKEDNENKLKEMHIIPTTTENSEYRLEELYINDPPDPTLIRQESFENYYVLPKICILILIWAIVVLFSLLKTPSIIGIELCSPLYWGLNVIQFSVIIVISILIAVYIRHIYLKKKAKDEENSEDNTDQIKWTKRNTYMLPPILILVGIIAAMVGLGGGVIQGPIMLEFGISPEVTVATSAYMILFTSSSIVLQYVISSKVPLDYALAFALTGFISSLTGHLVFGYFINKKDKPNLLVLILGIIITVTIVLAVGYGIYTTIIDFENSAYFGFNSLC